MNLIGGHEEIDWDGADECPRADVHGREIWLPPAPPQGWNPPPGWSIYTSTLAEWEKAL